jgi:hypothetical protein
MTYLDRTFCASPNCKNECGRMMTEMQTSQRKASFYASGFNLPVSYAYFCCEPEKEFAEPRLSAEK